MIDFETWRATYDSMSYAEHVALYDRVWQDHPLQGHADIDAARSFFAGIREPVRHVLEVGGWTGVTAGVILSVMPGIEKWLNVEVCRGAAEHPATTDPAYRAVVLDDWIWNQPSDFFAPFTVLFASHVFEHMTGANIAQLLGKIENIRHLYIDAPLPWEGDSDWGGYPGTHVLEWGWERLLAALKSRGWCLKKVLANHRERSIVCVLGRAGHD